MKNTDRVKTTLWIAVAMMGFKNFIGGKFELADGKRDIDLGTISLIPNDIKLKEVKVTGQKNFVEYEIDRTVLRDVFSSLEPNGRILNIPSAQASYYNDADTRVLVASFTYNFTKGTSGKRKRNVGGSGSEEQRVKN